jgi:hypothetical protein
MTVELACPSCGTISYFDELERDASAFCRTCDYPLFWARTSHVASGEAASEGESLRRLPGAAGRVAIATFACPVCAEPNTVAATICIRCGSELHPAPVPEPPPAPPPPPPPAPPEPEIVADRRRALWPVVLLWLLGALAIALIVAFALS